MADLRELLDELGFTWGEARRFGLVPLGVADEEAHAAATAPGPAASPTPVDPALDVAEYIARHRAHAIRSRREATRADKEGRLEDAARFRESAASHQADADELERSDPNGT